MFFVFLFSFSLVQWARSPINGKVGLGQEGHTSALDQLVVPWPCWVEAIASKVREGSVLSHQPTLCDEGGDARVLLVGKTRPRL